MRLHVLGAACGVLACLVAACGTLKCEPVPVTVAKKEERSRMDMVSKGVGTSPTGTVEEFKVPQVVHEYWVQGQDGTWYKVPEDRYRSVEVGGTLELCR